MATFILKNTTDTVSAAGQLEFNTDKKTLVVGDGTNQVVIAKMNVENEGSFLLTGDVKLSGSIYLGDVAADSIAALGTFTTNLIPNTNNSIDIGNTTRYWRNIYATSITGAIAATNGVISGSSQIAGILPAGVVSGSSQIVLRNTDGFSSYDSAISIITGSLIESASTAKNTNDSQNVSITNLNSTTASLNVSITNLNSTTASLNSTTASLNTSVSNLNTTTASLNTSISNLNTSTASLNISVSNINSTTESLNTSVSNINSTTASLNTSVSNLNLFTASLNTSVSNLNLFTASQLTQNSNLGTYTGSVEGRFSTLATYTGSNDTTNTNQNNRLTALEISSASVNLYTQSLKDAIDVTGGNTTIKGNLIVAGTTTAVQSTTLNVADKNIVIASGSLNSAASDGAGITIDGAGVSMSWSDSNERIELNKPLGILGAISASTIQGLNGVSVLDYSTSVDSRLSNIQLFTQSVEGRLSTLATYTGSVEGRFSTLATYTGSIDTKFTTLAGVTSSLHDWTASAKIKLYNLETTSASLNTSVSNINTFTASALNRLSNLETTSASLNTSVSNLNLFSSSQLDKDATLATLTASYDGRFTTIGTLTASYDGRFTTLATYTGSVEGRFSTLSILTSSYDNRFVEVGVVTGSLIASASTAKNTNDVQDTSITNLNLFSASVTSSLVSLYQTTASLNLFSASVTSSLLSIYQTTSSLNTHTASTLVSMSVIFTSASALDGRLDYLEGIAFGGLDISGQFTEIGNVTGSLITSASLVSQSVWHLHQFSASVTSSLVSLYQTTASLNLFTQSAAQRLNSIELQSGSWITETESGSFLITASVAGQTLTFTKGNGNTFDILIPTASFFTSSISVSGSITVSGSIANANYIDFNTASAVPAWKSGRVFWDDTDGCLAVYNNEADVTLQVGQENWTRVFNNSGVVINDGQPVRIVGTHGDVPEVVLAQSIAVSGSINLVNQVLGIATHTIEVGTFGYITTQGLVRGLNTNAFTDGDTIFLGTGSAGTLQRNAPIAPYEIIPIGQVVKASPGGSGVVYVAIQQPIDFSDLSSVLVEGTFDNGDMWQYVGSGVNGVWKHRTISEIGLVTTSSFNQYTSSGNISLEQLNQYTASNNTKWSTLGSLSGSFARTNSTNTFNGNQIVSGSLTVTQDFVVLGSSSIQNISSSTLNIGTNLITVAVNQPSVRFGGIAVIDSGSSGASGSLLYDAVQDEFIFLHRGNGTNVTSSHFLLGPETIDNLGNETYLTNNRIPKGTGKEHLNDSNISDTGTLITLGSNSVVNGTFYATGATLVSGSSQIDATATTNWATGIKTQLNSNTVISGSSQVNGTQITNNSIQIAGTSVALGGNIALITITGGSGIISGSGQLGNYETTGRGIVSGSSQVTPLLPAGTVSGSSQVIGILSSLNSYTASNDTTNTSQNTSITNLNNATSSYETKGRGIVSGSSQIVPLLPAGTLSGSAQLTNEFDSRYLNTGGDSVISSSAQIGNYVATITGTSNQVVVAGSGNNAAAVTLSLPQSIATTSDVQFNNITASAGIRATGDIIAYFSSDERLKENVQPIQNALSKVELISGNTYDWKEGFDNIHPHKGNDVGVIAQEVEKVLPQVVINRDNGYKAVDYEKIVPLLIEAIKELSAKVKELENK
jgi:hypothetical protein